MPLRSVTNGRQRNDARGPGAAVRIARAAHRRAGGAQRDDPERGGGDGAVAVRVRANNINGVLHGGVAAGLVLRPAGRQRGGRRPRPRPARHQGQGARLGPAGA